LKLSKKWQTSRGWWGVKCQNIKKNDTIEFSMLKVYEKP